MKNLRDKLEKIVKVLNCCEDKKCETCQMYTDKLLSLFKQQMKEIIGKDEKTVKIFDADGFTLNLNLLAGYRNELRQEQRIKLDQILQNIESL